MNAAPESRVERDSIDPRVWKITGVVALAPLMTSLDSTVVNVSLSTLGQELRVPLTTIQWVVTGYLLALALMLPLSGWLVDRVGAKRLYLGCFAAFTCASLLCGASTSAAALIGSRILQGMAGGLLAPMAQMMIARQAGRHVARVMGVMVVPVLLGPICGPTLAGLILQHASWRWIFFINLPIGILALVLAGWILPGDGRSSQARSFDLAGFLLLSPGLVLLLYSLERLSASSSGDLLGLSALALSIGLVVCFAVYAKGRAGAALIDLRLFRNATFAAAAVTQFLSNAVSFGGQMLLPLYLLSVPKISPAETGLLLAPAGLGMLCSYPSMGPLIERYGSRRISATGACVALAGTLPFAWPGSTHMPGWEICAALFVRGVGLGAISIPSIAAAYSSISKEAIPVATTAINIVQRLGGPVATTALAIYLHARMMLASHHDAPTQPASMAHAFAATFRLLCLIHVAVVVAASRLPLWAHQHVQTGDYDAEQAVEALTE